MASAIEQMLDDQTHAASCAIRGRAAGAAVRLGDHGAPHVLWPISSRSGIANAHRHRRARTVRAPERSSGGTSAGLLNEWETRASGDGHEFILYAPEPLGLPASTRRRFASRLVPGRPGQWWEQVRLPQLRGSRDHLDRVLARRLTRRRFVCACPRWWPSTTLSFIAHPGSGSGLREGHPQGRSLTRCAALRARERPFVTISIFSRGEMLDGSAYLTQRSTPCCRG